MTQPVRNFCMCDGGTKIKFGKVAFSTDFHLNSMYASISTLFKEAHLNEHLAFNTQALDVILTQTLSVNAAETSTDSDDTRQTACTTTPNVFL